MKRTILSGILSIMPLIYGCGDTRTTYPVPPKDANETGGRGGEAAAGQAGNNGANGGMAGLGGSTGGYGGAGGNGAIGGQGGAATQGGMGGEAAFGGAAGFGGVGASAGFGGSAGYGGNGATGGTGGQGGSGECNEDLTGKFATYTQGGWHNNPVAVQYLDDLFASGVSSVVIGNLDSDYALFDSAEAIKTFLPQGGSADALYGQYINPISTPAGVLGGQTLALTLNELYNQGRTVCGYHFDELIVINYYSYCYGMTVQEVLDQANSVLAGTLRCDSQAYKFNNCAKKINENFHEGTENHGYLSLPQ